MLIIFYVNYASTQSLCGDWYSFKDMKCIKIIDKETLHNFDDSEKICSQMSSTLITIHSAEEQNWISEFLFKTNKIVDNVWINMKIMNNKIEWKDSSDYNYKNWMNGMTSNKTDYNCVELSTEIAHLGQWVDVQCARKNVVVCQKSTAVDISSLQKIVWETRDKLKTLSDSLFNKWIHFKLFTDSDGKRKAFFIPLNEKYVKTSFEEAMSSCNKFNATLVEPKTAQKQQLFETFLGQLGLEGFKMSYFWINAKRDTWGKFRWLSTGEELTFTNWLTSNPHADTGYDYVGISAHESEANIATFGKWANLPKTYTDFVVCEQQINI